MSKQLNYLKNSHKQVRQVPLGALRIAGLKIYVKEPLVNNIDLEKCLEYIAHRMPSHIISGVDSIMVGQFPFLKKRDVEAIYKDGVIYMTNNHENNFSFISDIVHEIAHSFEEKENKNLYEDKVIENEFLSKRDSMLRILESQGLVAYPVNKQDFYNLNYDMKFDNYLYQIIGYDKLGSLTGGIFISPYAATCLREYFANAFENFFVNDINIVKKMCPNVYKKLINYLEF